VDQTASRLLSEKGTLLYPSYLYKVSVYGPNEHGEHIYFLPSPAKVALVGSQAKS
jgi:hypothetical protein